MMRIAAILCFSLVLLTGCRTPSQPKPQPAYQRNSTSDIPFETGRLENRFLTVEYAPAMLGRVSQVSLKQPAGQPAIPLLAPLKVTRYTETPLFGLEHDNSCGIREMFWGGKVNGISSMEVKEQTAAKAVLASRFYGNSWFGLERSIALLPDGLGLEVSATFVNHDSQANKIAPWLNLIGNAPATPILPAKGTGEVRGHGRQDWHTRDFLFTGQKDNSFLPPAQNWCGCRLAGRKVVWGITFAPEDFTPDGFFYSWGSADGLTPVIRTTEAIFPERILAPNEQHAIRYKLLVFPGLQAINALCGTTPLELRNEGADWEARLVPAMPVQEARPVTITLQNAEGKAIAQNSASLQPCEAGRLATIPLTVKGTPVIGTLAIGDSQAKILFER
ncbi:MAG: hypothetical protein IJJ33_17745 [Victivallales bacterium]|nr:hypothetical protein [Victivallales bacterium]